jgi:hypothetical protein
MILAFQLLLGIFLIWGQEVNNEKIDHQQNIIKGDIDT